MTCNRHVTVYSIMVIIIFNSHLWIKLTYFNTDCFIREEGFSQNVLKIKSP